MLATDRGRLLGTFALLGALALPVAALALTGASLRDLADPVPPGGILSYRVTLRDLTPPAPPIPSCFNPPAECVTLPVTCANPAPTCAGSAQAGFVCQNAANDGANCGVGAPPVANPQLCIARTEGACNGGPNHGLACTAPDGTFTSACPGFTFLCRRAFNEGIYCGTSSPLTPQCLGDPLNGFFCVDAENAGTPCGTTDPEPELCQPQLDPPAHAEPSFCLSNPTGICSGGPNFGLACSAPHGAQTAECPAGAGTPLPTTATVELPLPTGTSFIDADNGGTSNGTQVTWTVTAPASCLTPATPGCAPLNARLLVDPLVPEGTLLQSQVTATDSEGFLLSDPHLTTVTRIKPRQLTLTRSGAGRFTYRTQFALLATETLSPGDEPFGIRVSNSSGTIAEFTLAAGELPESSPRVFTYRNRGQGLRSVVLREIGPGLWTLRLRAAGLVIPAITDLTVTVDLTFGDDVLSYQARLLVKASGRRYVATPLTTTTTFVLPSTTTTTLP